MSDLVVTEFWEDGMCKGTLSHSDETMDGVMSFIGVSIHDVDDENELVSIELRDTSFVVATIKVLDQMMRKNKSDRWNFFLKNIPCLLSECDSYRIEFRKAVIEYNRKKGYYLSVKEGKFGGKAYDLSKYLFDNREDKALTDEEIGELCNRYNDRCRTLFKGMKNIDNFMVKARVVGLI